MAKKDPFLDGSKPVYICRDPLLHVHWFSRSFMLAFVFFILGVVLQWALHLIR